MFEEIREQPTILCGHPKSGTTLLLALLDNHPQLSVFPEELKFFKRVCGQSKPAEAILTRTGFNVFRFNKVVFSSGERDYSDIDFQFIESEIHKLCKACRHEKDLLLGCMKIWYEAGNSRDLGREKTRWVEKTPGNEKYLRMYEKWFSNKAIYLHMLRDPRDNFASYKRKKRYLTPEAFSKSWALSTEIALYAQRWVKNYHVIRYEDLVLTPRVELMKICQILGIDFSDSLFHPTRNGKPWAGNSTYGTKFSGISFSSMGKYKDQLHAEEIHFLEANLASYMERFGYILQFPELTSYSKVDNTVRMALFKWRLESRFPGLLGSIKKIKNMVWSGG